MLNILSAVPEGDAPDALIIALCVLGAVAVILAISGSVLGYKRKIVVYYGRDDLYLTIVSIVSWMFSVMTVGLAADKPWIVLAMAAWSAIVTLVSIALSFRANNTIWAGILSVFAKYALLMVIASCAALAISGALAAMEDTKKKQYKDATKSAAAAAVGAAGFLALRKLISRLITEKKS
ncbi:MAG: hypothetical protein FJ395_18615 [Verrucomicrobia bacterium]|nr:hypothetical protein [Verrucomicrobiota bacterium]